MTIELTLQKEIEQSQRNGSIEKTMILLTDGILKKRIELINWVLDNMKNPENQICNLIESRMNVVIMTINQTRTIFEADKLHSELNILHWIFYVVCNVKFEQS
jgi:uncharacterized protein involved in exopolysaccharide biosynthesis